MLSRAGTQTVPDLAFFTFTAATKPIQGCGIPSQQPPDSRRALAGGASHCSGIPFHTETTNWEKDGQEQGKNAVRGRIKEKVIAKEQQ